MMIFDQMAENALHASIEKICQGPIDEALMIIGRLCLIPVDGRTKHYSAALEFYSEKWPELLELNLKPSDNFAVKAEKIVGLLAAVLLAAIAVETDMINLEKNNPDPHREDG